MTEIRRNEPAKEKQIEKLRFFGCTWDDGITAGQASDALEECAKLFPDREAAWQLQKADLLKAAEILPQSTTLATSKVETPQQYLERTGRASDPAWQRWAKAKQISPPEVKIQKTEIVKSPTTPAAAPVFIPPTPEQLNEIRSFGKEPPNGLTFAEAEIWIEQCKILFPAKSQIESQQQVTIQKAEKPAAQTSARHDVFSSRRPVGRKQDAVRLNWGNQKKLTFKPKQGLHPAHNQSIKPHDESSPEVTIQKSETVASQSAAMWCSKCQKSSTVEHHGRQWCPDCGTFVTTAEPQIADEQNVPAAPKKSEVDSQQSVNKWGELFKIRQSSSDKTPSEEVTIQEAAKPQIISPREIIPGATDHLRQFYEMYCPACNGEIQVLQGTVGKKRTCPHCHLEITPVFTSKNTRKKVVSAGVVPDSAQPATIQKPEKEKTSTFAGQRLDDVLKDCPSSDGCYWLPVMVVAKLANIFAETKLTNSESRQIANKIEWFGYCFEPDARYGNGTYDIDQTLAVFKPFEGDQINPSTAYLGAANLLRLCVLIAVADGQIDEVELDVFRQVIENQIDLTPTDHRRLQVLEKLLVQDPSSAKKTLANVIKSVPAHKRLLIGKVLVRVAAADTVITKDERRALERIFKAFEISQDTLENLMFQACPPSPEVTGQKSAPISIPVKPVAPKESGDKSAQQKKEWDEWLALHERLSARQKLPSPEVSTDEHIFIPREARGLMISTFQVSTRLRNIFEQKQFRILGDIHDISYAEFRKFPNCGSRTVEELRELVQKIRCEPMTGQAAAPAPLDFALDMAKVYSITNETQEVVGILSVLMADEPEKSIAPSAIITLPAPQPTRFNGLDAAFCPILERLLTRDSWPMADFNALAHEVQFMPLNIRDTLNVWSDEALGDFILDGEDPVIIRRNLITK